MYERILQRLVGDDYTLIGSEANAICPVHEQRTGKVDHKPSFYFNIDSGLCYCFSCGYRANHYILWRDIKGEDLEVDEVIPEEEQIKLLRAKFEKIEPRSFTLPTIMDEADLNGFDWPSPEMRITRGISPEVIEELEIHASGDAWIIPIRHIITGVLMGIQIKDGKFVRNAPIGVRKGLSLFGLDRELDPDKPVVVVESPLDVAVCLTHGVQAVATYGANVTADQQLAIMRFPEVVLAFDNDTAGRDATKELERFLASRVVPFRTVEWPEGMKDPGDAQEEIVKLVAYAPTALARRLKGN
jgi:Toprim-like